MKLEPTHQQTSMRPGCTEVGLDNNTSAPIQNWLLSLRSLNRSVLLIHHAGKGGQQRGTSRRESGRTLLGEFDFEKYVKIQNQLKKKYGLTFDPGKIKTTMFLSDLQKMGRINTIYGDGTFVLSILRYRMQDSEPMDRLSVFYNSKSVADAVMKDLKKMKLKEDDL